MVLVDSKGNKNHATAKKDQVAEFYPFLSLGVSRLMINFSVMHSGGSYRSNSHPYRILFSLQPEYESVSINLTS
ncbi:hypothetical protein Bca4012_009269 [Brassica carinata]